MNQREGRVRGNLPSKNNQSGEYDSWVPTQRAEIQHRQRSLKPTPAPRTLSFGDNKSITQPLQFEGGPHSDFDKPAPAPRRVSYGDDRSIAEPLQFKDGLHSDYQKSKKQQFTPHCSKPEPMPRSASSCASFGYERSIAEPLHFKDGLHSDYQTDHQQIYQIPDDNTNLDSIFLLLEDNIISFVKKELKKIQNALVPDNPEFLQSENEDDEESLGKLAFEQLQKGNLIFYESDLTECGIDIKAASMYSGVFTQVFREERGLYQDKVFCFVHLSVQEFLAALHVHLTFIKSGVNLMEEEEQTGNPVSKIFRDKPKLRHLYESAVDRAIQSPNGHLDLFLRFLLGLSLQTNQTTLKNLLPEPKSSPKTIQKSVEYIKKKIGENMSAERNINLFHCLNELKDHSLEEEIQQYLTSGVTDPEELSSSQWSALVFILLSSENNLDVFDLKKYSASETALLRLLPVVKASKKALLNSCRLSERGCEGLASVLSSQFSSLRELDLSNNDLQDSGVKLLCSGLKDPLCKLETLSLAGCMITEKGFTCLAAALNTKHSLLREMDLSYNHPGHSGRKSLSSGLENPHRKLDVLRLGNCGEQRIKPGLRKYACDLTLDSNTANRNLRLSDNCKNVSLVKNYQMYPDHPDRFECWEQILCEEGVTGRCYWEVGWTGEVYISLTYRGIGRRGNSDDCVLGRNDVSWSLSCTEDGYSVCHKNKETNLPLPPSPGSHRVAVYVDFPAGSLSFYTVSSGAPTHLHTFYTTFTEPLYPGFRLRSYCSSVVLGPF